MNQNHNKANNVQGSLQYADTKLNGMEPNVN